MKRRNIERSEYGLFMDEPEGLDKFCASMAQQLLEQFPEIDYMDLKILFNNHFQFAYSRAMSKEIAQKKMAKQ